MNKSRRTEWSDRWCRRVRGESGAITVNWRTQGGRRTIRLNKILVINIKLIYIG